MTSDTLARAPQGASPSTQRPRQRRSIGQLWDTWGITGVLFLLVLVAAVVDDNFLDAANVQSILRESAYLGIVAAGMTFAIINGTFDLSVAGQLALVSVVSLLAYGAGGTGLAVLAAVGTGLACGAANAVLITGLRVPPFVATLGMLFVFRGVAYLLTADGPATLPYSEVDSAYVQIGSLNVAGLPLPFLLMVAVFGAAWVLLRRTAIGRRVVAFGSSAEAARFCGISATRVRLFVFVLVGLCVGLAALTYVTRIWTADGATQDGFELRVIAAVVLGGTSLRGGRGTLIGTFSAVLLVQVLNDLLVGQGVDAAYQRVILGAVLVAALGIDGLRTRFAAPGSFRRAVTRRRVEVTSSP